MGNQIKLRGEYTEDGAIQPTMTTSNDRRRLLAGQEEEEEEELEKDKKTRRSTLIVYIVNVRLVQPLSFWSVNATAAAPPPEEIDFYTNHGGRSTKDSANRMNNMNE